MPGPGVRVRGVVEGLVTSAEELEVLVRDIRQMHRRKVTSTGVKCGECAVWENFRLKRAPWPCDTIQLVGEGDE